MVTASRGGRPKRNLTCEHACVPLPAPIAVRDDYSLCFLRNPACSDLLRWICSILKTRTIILHLDFSHNFFVLHKWPSFIWSWPLELFIIYYEVIMKNLDFLIVFFFLWPFSFKKKQLIFDLFLFLSSFTIWQTFWNVWKLLVPCGKPTLNIYRFHSCSLSL